MRIYRSTIIALLLTGTALVACGDAEGTPESVKDQRTISRLSSEEGLQGDVAGAETGSAVGDESVATGSSVSSGSSTSSANKRTSGATPGAVSIGESAPNSRTNRAADDETANLDGATENPSAGETDYEPSRFAALLQKYVAGGRVNYSGFAKNSEFNAHLESLKTVDPGSMSTNEALAFWVNAYNALVIKNVNDNPGMKKPTNVNGFFDRTKFTVANQSLTLNDIENKVVRPKFNEPLIHFGLVCAARSCPPLVPQLYTSSNVRSLLAKNATSYLADATQNSFDPASGTLRVSRIFEWYIADFGGDHNGIIAFVTKHAPDSMADEISAAESVTVVFNEYDWRLNSR